jgi:hypothetical protein
MRFQTGTGRKSASVKVLAVEAKVSLGGYFRKLTMVP